jgi:uncharacterized protein with PQ loop repeat
MSLHHYHTRKRREPYPAQTLYMRLLDGVIYVVGILGPLATIPQVLKIYVAHDAAGVSLFSWAIYALFDIPWIMYAIAHKERPLIICYTLWFFFNSLVLVGVLLYGSGPSF